MTCYDLDRARLSGTIGHVQDSGHDFWTLLRSLHQIKRASESGCEICYVLLSGLLSAIDSSAIDSPKSLDARDFHVNIQIPQLRHNRVRTIAYSKPASPPTLGAVESRLDLEFYCPSLCKSTRI